jgi:hypothetical protein
MIVKNIDPEILKIDLDYFPYLKKNEDNIKGYHLDFFVYPTNS